MADFSKTIRSYEISVWTLQDECITVLKPSELEFKGEVQNAIAEFVDDGTESLSFSVPMYYYDGGVLTLNPAWSHILEGHFSANMHKVKLIFNKATEDEKVYEMLITNVNLVHTQDQITYEITCEGLAFHELGKLGYKISLSSVIFENEYTKWFEDGQKDSEGNSIDAPRANILYWNDKIFRYDGQYVLVKNEDNEVEVVFQPGDWKYGWTYEVNMDWSGYSHGEERDPHKVYEEEYVASWSVDPFDYDFTPTRVEGFREKWRQFDEEESNIYNLTLTIALKFGVYCRYEYEHDVNYHITGRKVIYYNSAFREQEGYTDLTYPYNAARVLRTIDNTDTITKLFVRPIESDSSSSNLISITTVDGNKSKEDYLLNFDYLRDVHTITEELYELIHIYEGKLREINELAVTLEAQIILVLEELVKVRADYTTYTNAILLDNERMNNARLLKELLTGDLGYITLTAANPDTPILHLMSNTSNSYYITLKEKGIIPATVKMYCLAYYSRHPEDRRLDKLIVTGDLEFDEFNNLYKISNIYIDDESLKKIYVTYSYSPYLYYEKVEKTWRQRLALDTVNLLKADLDMRSLELMLYSADMDYCHADYATADASSMLTSARMDELRVVLNDISVLDYNKDKIDFNARAFSSYRKYNVITHRNGEVDTVPEVYYETTLFVYGGIWDEEKPRYVVVNPVLPNGDVIKEYVGRQWVYERVASWARLYAQGLITLKTRIQDLDSTIRTTATFGDIYIAMTDNAAVALSIIDAFWAYDNSNLTTSCMFVGNATTDFTYTDERGYIDKALTDEAHGYCALYDFLLEKKYKIITNFEKWMGPALREGYWQADDYNDYGNKYSEKFTIYNNLNDIEPYTTYGYNKPELINFTWDHDNIFTGETDGYYEVGVNLKKEYYVAVDLTPFLDRLFNYMDNLCFIYYDNKFLTLNKEIDDEMSYYEEFTDYYHADMSHDDLNRIIYLEAYGTDDNDDLINELKSLRATLKANLDRNGLHEDDFVRYKSAYSHLNHWEDSKVYNINAAKRWFTIGSLCEFGYAWIDDIGYKPVLILTGLKDLTVQERLSIVAPDEDYEPFLGIISSDIVQYRDADGRQLTRVDVESKSISTDFKRLPYIRFDPNPHPEENLSGNTYYNDEGELVVDTTTYPHTINYVNSTEAVVAHPRIRVNSLELKNNSSDLLMAVNGYTTKYIEDYYVLMKLDKADDEYKYFITIKPEIFIKYAYDSTPTIVIHYATSNASEAVYLDAIKVMKENAYPKVSYEVDLNVLNPHMVRNAFNKLRSIIHINDYELLLDKTTGYISKITLDLDQPRNDTVEIKNYETKFEDLFSTIVALTESMKKNENTISIAAAAFSPGGTLYTSVLQDSLLKADLNYSFNQGKLTIDEENGIWGTSTDGVVAFRGGGIFTASTKGPNGEWEWNTGILPTGINADLITTGQLDTNKIRIYAGDKVAFLMNGEGLFAYKTYAKDQLILGLDEELETKYRNGNTDDIDALLFVTFNEDGLFLTSKKGTMVPDAAKEYKDFRELLSDVNRVEISWEGLKLRNYDGDRTFYADPDTGNLTLKGTIESDNGHIGGWTIGLTGLLGTYINIVNSDTDRNNNGIFLTNKASAAEKTIQYNGDTYYAYKILYTLTKVRYNSMDEFPIPGEEEILYVDNSTSRTYYWDNTDYLEIDIDRIFYCNALATNSLHAISEEDSVITYVNEPVSCRPKWTVSKTLYMEVTTGTTINPDGTSTVDKTPIPYVLTYIAYTNNGEPIAGIVYDGSDSLSSTWYYLLLAARPSDYPEYVIYTEMSKLRSIDLGVGTVLVLDSYLPTFSVYAHDGTTLINKGKMGPFTLTKTYMDGTNDSDDVVGEIRNSLLRNCDLTNSYVKVSKTVKKDNLNVTEIVDETLSGYGSVIKNIWGNSSAGTINFERINGTTGNFNVADMYYYRSNISAAQLLNSFTCSTTINGTSSYVTIYSSTNTSNIGTSASRTETYGVGNVYSAGWNAVKISSISDAGLSGSNITVTATANNGDSKTVTLSASTVYGNGKSEGAGGVNVSDFEINSASFSGGIVRGGLVVYLNNNKTYNSSFAVPCSGGGGGGTCFVAGTMIQLADGSIMPIEKLTVDTLLKAYDEDTEQFTTSTIQNVLVFHRPSSIVSIYCDSGDILTLTESHPILTDRGWAAYDVEAAAKEHTNISIEMLTEDDKVLTTNGWSQIKRIEKRDDLNNPPVYNLDVEPVDTYIANNIVVHNADAKDN